MIYYLLIRVPQKVPIPTIDKVINASLQTARKNQRKLV